MNETSTPAYGTTRERGANVSYAEVERAALDLLGAGERPAVASVRARLGRGSPATLADALKRFWRDLGVRAQGDPAALTRLPSEIVETVDTLWQRALTLAQQAAKQDDNAARERLRQIQLENELRAQSFALREKELETSARARERALAEAQEHVRTLIGMLETDRITLRARERRISDLEAQVEDYRKQLAALTARAVARNRVVAQSKIKKRGTGKPKGRARSRSPARRLALKVARKARGTRRAK